MFQCGTDQVAAVKRRGERFLRTLTTGTNTLTLVFEGLPPHNQIGIGLLLAQLDSLDPVRDNDHFAIRVDGQEVFKAGFGFGVVDTLNEPEVAWLELFGQPADPQLVADTLTLGGENLFYAGTETADYNEHVYDLTQLDALQRIPHKGSTLEIELIGYHNQIATSEGFGLDHVQVTVEPLTGTLIIIN